MILSVVQLSQCGRKHEEKKLNNNKQFQNGQIDPKGPWLKGSSRVLYVSCEEKKERNLANILFELKKTLYSRFTLKDPEKKLIVYSQTIFLSF